MYGISSIECLIYTAFLHCWCPDAVSDSPQLLLREINIVINDKSAVALIADFHSVLIANYYTLYIIY